jgi:hypothetical protein
MVKNADDSQLTFPFIHVDQISELEMLALELYDEVFDTSKAIYQRTRQMLMAAVPAYLHKELDSAVTGSCLFGVVPAALTRADDSGMLSKPEEKTKQYLCFWMGEFAILLYMVKSEKDGRIKPGGIRQSI